MSVSPSQLTWLQRLRPGAQVSSRLTGDIGDVVGTDALGLFIRWRVGVREYVLFSQSESLMRKSWRKRVPVFRIGPGDDDTSPEEQEEIRQRIAEVRAEKRARGEFCNPAYAVSDELAECVA